MEKQYKEWLKLRQNSTDEFGEKMCYCGHTSHCECGDPDIELFKHQVRIRNITPGDPRNGWRSGGSGNHSEIRYILTERV